MFVNLRNWIVHRPRRTAAGLILIVLVTFGAIWGILMAGRAEDLAVEMRNAGSSAETALASADPATVAEVSGVLDSSMRSARELDEDLWPLRLAGAVVGWIPVLGDNVMAVPYLVDRLNDDLVAAVALIDAAEVLVTAYVELPATDAGLIDTLNALPTDAEIADAVRLISEAKLALTEADNTASEMDSGRLIQRLERASEELGAQEARLREVVEWAGLAAESLAALARLGDISLPLVEFLDGDNSTGAALGRDALSAMTDLEVTAQEAHLAMASTNAITPSGISNSEVGDVLADFETLLGGLVKVAKAGALTWAAVSPALDEMESSPGGLIGEGTSILIALELLKEQEPGFLEARLTLESVAPELRQGKFRTQSGVSTARTLSDASVELAHAVGFLSDFPEIGAQVLGSDGPKRYLVLGQTSDELRGSGGFVSGAWVVTFNNGQMSDIEYHDIVSVDDRSNLASYPLPPELLAQHMDAPVWLVRDAMWSPEYPAAARTAAEIFKLGQGGPEVDGVIALTQWAFVGLVEALGTINTDRREITAEELLPVLEEGTDAEGRAFVDKVFRSVLDELRSPGMNVRLFGIARAASKMLNKKDALVYMSDPALQDVIARSGWDGSLGRPDGDRIAIIDSNIGWNKADRNIRRSFEYHVALHPSGPMEARLDLSYRNVSDPAGRGCDAQTPIHGLSYAELKESCYWNLLRVYLPDGGTLVSSDPLTVPAKSVYALVAAGLSGDDSVNIGVGPGGKFISGLLVVPPGETVSTGFNIIVPAGALVSDEDVLTYRLSLTAQSGVLGRDALINLEIPEGYEYVGSSHEPSSLEDTAVEFTLELETDTIVEITMRPTPTAAGNRIDADPTGLRTVSLR